MSLSIHQTIVIRDANGPRTAAKSAGIPFDWEECTLRVAARFGPRPDDTPCPAALMVVDIDKAHVAVVQIADAPAHGNGFVPLRFRFLILETRTYDLLGDPFAVADAFPATANETGELPTLEWPAQPLPQRKVETILALLKSGDMPLLLGATQALLDGGSLLLIESEPQNDVLRSVWQLLPDRSRSELRMATFAFSGELGFQVWAMPKAPEPWPERTLTAEQTRDYPEGRYELALQVAAEGGQQADLDRLLARRSSKDVLRLAASMVAFALVAALIGKFLL